MLGLLMTPRTPGGAAADFMETARNPQSPDPVNIRYVGNRINGLKHGEGVQMWADGRRYVGQFQCGHFHGSGTMSWPDGRTYRGEYAEGYKHGEGAFCWQDGRMYSGEWVKGKRHGRGMYINAKGESGVGMWADDRPKSWSSHSMTSTNTPSSRPARTPCSVGSIDDPFAIEEIDAPPVAPLPTLLNSGLGKKAHAEKPPHKAEGNLETPRRQRKSLPTDRTGCSTPTTRSGKHRMSFPLDSANLGARSSAPTPNSRRYTAHELPIMPEVPETPETNEVSPSPNCTNPLDTQKSPNGASLGRLNFVSLLEFWQGRDKKARSSPNLERPEVRPSPRVCKPAFGPMSFALQSPRQPCGDQGPLGHGRTITKM